MAWNTLNNFHIINAESMAASITSVVQIIQFQDNIGIQLVWSGTPIGDFTVEISSNYSKEFNIAGDWTNLPLTPAISAVGAADNAYIDLNQLSAPALRIKYNRSSSSGTLDAYIVAKGV